jgi:hypothetical protein
MAQHPTRRLDSSGAAVVCLPHSILLKCSCRCRRTYSVGTSCWSRNRHVWLEARCDGRAPPQLRAWQPWCAIECRHGAGSNTGKGTISAQHARLSDRVHCTLRARANSLRQAHGHACKIVITRAGRFPAIVQEDRGRATIYDARGRLLCYSGRPRTNLGALNIARDSESRTSPRSAAVRHWWSLQPRSTGRE